MMKEIGEYHRFYIEAVGAGSSKVGWSTLNFKDGVNIISGPSNRGKSTVLHCIAFVLGESQVPEAIVEYGGDTVTLDLVDGQSGRVALRRKIVEKPDSLGGEGKICVSTNLPGIMDGNYGVSGGFYSTLLLSLLGITSPPTLVVGKTWETRQLDFETLMPFIYLDELRVVERRSPLSPSPAREVRSLTALWYLLTGEDLAERVPMVNGTQIKEKAAIRAVGIQYQDDRKKAYFKAIEKVPLPPDLSDADIEARITVLLDEAQGLEAALQEANGQYQHNLKALVPLETALETKDLALSRLLDLRSQYMGDLARLHFQDDGGIRGQMGFEVSDCPLCGGTLTQIKGEEEAVDTSAVMTAITAMLADLEATEGDLSAEMSDLDAKRAALCDDQQRITTLLEKTLKPRMAALKGKLSHYHRLLAGREERRIREATLTDINTERNRLESEKDPELLPFDPKDLYRWDAWKALEATITPLVVACGYPGAKDVSLSLRRLDLAVGGKAKAAEGKGYRAFLSTILLFGLMNHLGEVGCYAPHLLMVDSPVLTLLEQPGADGMKAGLFRTLIEGCGDNQIIIVENELPEGVDYSNVNRITFGEDGGRDGFLVR